MKKEVLLLFTFSLCLFAARLQLTRRGSADGPGSVDASRSRSGEGLASQPRSREELLQTEESLRRRVEALRRDHRRQSKFAKIEEVLLMAGQSSLWLSRKQGQAETRTSTSVSTAVRNRR